MTKSILIQGYSSLYPVIAGLSQKGDYQLFFFQNFNQQAMSDWGFEPVELVTFLSDEGKERVKRYLQTHARRWEGALRNPQFAEQFLWQGRPLLQRMGASFHREIQETFAYGAELVESFRALHARHPLSLVVLSNDVAPGTKTLTRTAQACGVPVLHVEHASPGFAYPWAKQVNADHLAVFGPRDRDLYLAWGAKPDQIRVTGCPQWDRYHNRVYDRAQARRRLGWPEEGRVALFCSTWAHRLSAASTWGHVIQAFQAVLLAGREHDVRVAVRAHPATPQGDEWHARIASQTGFDAPLVAGDLADSLVASDAVFCFDSNAGIEALLVGRPVVTLRFPPFRASLFGPDDAVRIATSEADVRDAFRVLRADRLERELAPRRPASVTRHTGPRDGLATQRVLAWIDDLVDPRDKRSHAESHHVTV